MKLWRRFFCTCCETCLQFFKQWQRRFGFKLLQSRYICIEPILPLWFNFINIDCASNITLCYIAYDRYRIFSLLFNRGIWFCQSLPNNFLNNFMIYLFSCVTNMTSFNISYNRNRIISTLNNFLFKWKRIVICNKET